MHHHNDERIFDELRAGAPVAHIHAHSAELHRRRCRERATTAWRSRR